MTKLIKILVIALASSDALSQATSGTGFFVSPNGLLATNWHVVQGKDDIVVIDHGGEKRKAILLAKDRANDLAVLKVEGNTHAWLPIADSMVGIKRGTEVITVGYPQIGLQGHEPKVTNGIVSSLSGIDDDPRLYQITVPIQPGNSGGALVTFDGLVIGVVTYKLSAIETIKATGTLPEGVNYAVKSNYLKEILRNHKVQSEVDVRRSRRNANLVELTERVEKATVLILAGELKGQNRTANCLIKSDCSYNEYCHESVCLPLKKYGEEFTSSSECSNELWCKAGRCGLGSL